MSLDRLYQLDPASGTGNSVSNYAGANIQESCQPSTLNNALRALGSMIAHEFHFQAAAISSSVSTNLVTSSTSWFVPVTGANAVNSWGVVPGEFPNAAVLRFVQFSSSASLSHGGALRLVGGASRRTQPGDIGAYFHAGSSDSWHELFYSRADGALSADSISVTTITNRSMSTSAVSTVTLNAASMSVTNIALTTISAGSISASVGNFNNLKVGGHGTVAQFVRDTEATYTDLGVIIPQDDSIPQNTEGDEVLSVAITPVNASSTLLINVVLHLGGATGDAAIGALFVDSTAGALAAGATVNGNTAQMTALAFSHSLTAGSTSARTYKVRAGSDQAANAKLNGDNAARQFGGVAISSLTVTEILPQ
jgi:hypothetical protein